ncbi:MAG TPA: hypothetical protein PLZ36_14220 [Armatimonadota bacterium]|mgnify:CR=1 FL=1|nr:hypothetical protein [Armatimonadota bacterium]
MATVRRYAFLTPGHNNWNVWFGDKAITMTNPGQTHRVLESLAYVLDELAKDGWQVRQIFMDQQGAPNLVVCDCIFTT